jgi:hypothetical protein
VVNGDGADPAGLPGPIRPGDHLVAFTAQGIAYLRSQAALDAQLIGVVSCGSNEPG